jgi:tyrosinase
MTMDSAERQAQRAKLMSTWASDTQTHDMTETEKAWFSQNCDVEPRTNLPPCIRKEYRAMTSTERNRFHKTVNKMKKSVVDSETGSTVYDLMIMKHNKMESPGAHKGPAFLVWHRYFCFIFEQRLRAIDPNVCLPYWCSGLDSYLSNLRDSVIFTPEYAGTASGTVREGFAANWKAEPDECKDIGDTLCRVTNSDSSLLLSDDKVNEFLSRPSYEEAVNPYYSGFEDCHGDVHVAIGGHMAHLECAPCDCLFFMHHNYINYLLEKFMDQHPRSKYPDTDIEYNNADDPLYPWEHVTVGEVFNKDYSSYYTYEESPGDCTSHEDCCAEDGALWCDTTDGKCKAKVMEQGECGKMPHDCCYCPPGYTPRCRNSNCQCLE